MPQITLEYSSNLKRQKQEFKPLFARLHTLLEQSLGVNILNCKSRAQRRKSFHIADGQKAHAFAHLEIKIMEGRSPEQHQLIGKEAMSMLQDSFKNLSSGLIFQPSVEIVEIKPSNYFKLSADEIYSSYSENPTKEADLSDQQILRELSS